MTNVEKLIERLNQGVVKFSFTKKDGSVRDTVGTRHLDTIKKVYNFKGGESPAARVGYISFYDMEKSEWRCFNPTKVISAEGIF